MALTAYPGVGVFQRCHDTRHAGCNECVRTRRRTAVMAAGLKRDVRSCPARGVSCHFHGDGFRMGPAALACRGYGNNGAVLDDHAADCRVLGGGAAGTPACGNGAAHVIFIIHEVISRLRRSQEEPQARSPLRPTVRRASLRSPWPRGSSCRPRRSAHRPRRPEREGLP